MLFINVLCQYILEFAHVTVWFFSLLVWLYLVFSKWELTDSNLCGETVPVHVTLIACTKTFGKFSLKFLYRLYM